VTVAGRGVFVVAAVEDASLSFGRVLYCTRHLAQT
jgi:hypothetical protein